MQLTEKKSAAIVLIIAGLFMLKGPALLTMWLIPGAEDAPSFAKGSMELMIAGGVMLVVGAAMAWHAWRQPRT